MSAQRTSVFRIVASLLAAISIFVGLAACGVGSNSENEEASRNTDFQPVSITHALGTAKITQKPTRVVTLGQGSTETAIALGVTPVAMEAYVWSADSSGYYPWVKEAVEKKGGKLPAILKGHGTDISAEEVLSYHPDLILAPWSGMTADQYKQFSEIAPTIAYKKAPWSSPWDEQIRTVAEALGYKDKADGLIQDINNQFAAAQKPEYKNTTFTYIYNNPSSNELGVFFPQEQRAAVVEKLGFTMDPAVEKLKSTSKSLGDSTPLSMEKVDILKNSDLIFTYYWDENNRREMHENPVYASIPAIARGSEVAAADHSLVSASSMINPITVPWMLKRYIKLIDEAIAKLKVPAPA